MRYLAISIALHLVFLGVLRVVEHFRDPKFSVSQNSIFHLSLISQKGPVRVIRNTRQIPPAGNLHSRSASLSVPSEQNPARSASAKVSHDAYSPLFEKSEADDFYTPSPRYPFVARENGWQGEVVFKLKTDPDGYIESLEIVSSSGYALLDEEAYRSLKQWRLAPKLIAEVPIIFKLRE